MTDTWTDSDLTEPWAAELGILPEVVAALPDAVRQALDLGHADLQGVRVDEPMLAAVQAVLQVLAEQGQGADTIGPLPEARTAWLLLLCAMVVAELKTTAAMEATGSHDPDVVQYAIATTGPGWEVSAPAPPSEDRMPPPTGMRAPTGTELTHDELVLLFANTSLLDAARHIHGEPMLGTAPADDLLLDQEAEDLTDRMLADCLYTQLHPLDYLHVLAQAGPAVVLTPREVQMQRIQARDGAQ